MKGGRTAPRNFRFCCSYAPVVARFNEGGADCPPKLIASPLDLHENPYASMKGGRTAPRNEFVGFAGVGVFEASMKGGRTAPRNRA